MIDTLRLRLDVADVGGANKLSSGACLWSAVNYLSEVRYGEDANTGARWAHGRLGNADVTINSGSIYVEVALPTILYPSNARILTRNEISQAIEKICDLLHLPMWAARITRLDCSYHWPMSRPVNEFITRLGELSRFTRVLQTENTLLYHKGRKKLPNGKVKHTNEILFYNKSQECQDKRKYIPDAYEDSLVLRYECRFLNNPSQQFGMTELKAADLGRMDFYKCMVDKWAQYYFSVAKYRRASYDFSGVKDVRTAKEWLLGFLLSHQDATNINEVLLSMKEQKTFPDAKYYSRLRKDLQEAVAKVGSDTQNDLIRELDNNVRNVVAYYR